MAFEELRLASPTGADLALYHLPSRGTARGILLISHGLAEHARRYAPFATALAGHGFHVYAHDHRGHGATGVTGGMRGLFASKSGIAAVLNDLAAVRDAALARHPGLPLILFGHSMGGLIALNDAEVQPGAYAGLAVWNSSFYPGAAGRAAQGWLGLERMLKGSDVPSPLIARLTFGDWSRAIPDRRTDLDWLSNDPAAVDAYIADPLCGFDATISLWIDLFRLSFAGAAPARLARLPRHLPVHLVGGGEDPATRRGRDILRLADDLRQAGLQDVTAMVYPGARHETLNDTVRDTATEEFAAWCRRVAASADPARQERVRP